MSFTIICYFFYIFFCVLIVLNFFVLLFAIQIFSSLNLLHSFLIALAFIIISFFSKKIHINHILSYFQIGKSYLSYNYQLCHMLCLLLEIMGLGLALLVKIVEYSDVCKLPILKSGTFFDI